jgi:hypothetical protein
MAARDVATLLDCSNCEMPLVVLPLALFPSVADWDGNQIAKLPGEVTDHEGERVAMYTVVDGNGTFACPVCSETASFSFS